MEKLIQKSEVSSQSGEDIVNRKHNEIYFHDLKIPAKLSAFESVLKLFSEDENIVSIFKGFTENIIESDVEQHDPYGLIIPALAKRYKALEVIRDNTFDTFTKLALVHENVPDVFDKIKENLIDVFPEIEDMTVRFKPYAKIRIKVEPFEELSATNMVLYVKIAHVDGWISHHYLSAGMLKTLIFITDMHLCPEGTVLLIDEFENSLGVNCIDILDDLSLSRKGFQYIITSHHPYIINNIPMSYWKVVTRQGGVVKSLEAKDLKLGKSKHEAFMQLMQLDEFVQGANTQ
jgi:hypothetical protein